MRKYLLTQIFLFFAHGLLAGFCPGLLAEGIREAALLGVMGLVFDPDVFFDDHSIDPFFLDFFNASLDQGVVVDGHGECKGLAFPIPVLVIIQVFGILVTCQGVAAAAGIEVIGGILRRVGGMAQERKVGIIDDLDHVLILVVMCHFADAFRDDRSR
jgi:hypothetical protein